MEAWDFQGCANNREEIDVLSKSISLPSDTEQEIVEGIGENGIGYFNFTHQVLKIANENITEYTTDESTVNGAEKHATEFPALTLAWIAVAIFFILLTAILLLVSIILAFVVRNMDLKMKELRKGITCDNHGEKHLYTKT